MLRWVVGLGRSSAGRNILQFILAFRRPTLSRFNFIGSSIILQFNPRSAGKQNTRAISESWRVLWPQNFLTRIQMRVLGARVWADQLAPEKSDDVGTHVGCVPD